MRRLVWAFGLDKDWRRPLNARRALVSDALLAAVFCGYALVSLLTALSLGLAGSVPLAITVVWILLPGALLTFRRLAPLASLSISIVHVSVTALFVPDLAAVFGVQIYYFVVLFTCLAWATRRQWALGLAVLQLVVILGWIYLDYSVRGSYGVLDVNARTGLLAASTAAMLQTLMSSLAFWFAAVACGVVAWHAGWREVQAVALARQLEEQTQALREQAIVDERLRMARDLHDIVGHHVTVIGIQASAARRVLDVRPEEARSAISVVGAASRSATRELRMMLGTLRPKSAGVQPDSDPAGTSLVTLDDLSALARSSESLGLRVVLDLPRDCDWVPAAVVQTLYRCLQESLTNIHKHSTADTAWVELALEAPDPGLGLARLRVADNGRPREDSSGSQVGLAGMAERVNLHGGTMTSEATSDGYVVSVTLPFVPAKGEES